MSSLIIAACWSSPSTRKCVGAGELPLCALVASTAAQRVRDASDVHMVNTGNNTLDSSGGNPPELPPFPDDPQREREREQPARKRVDSFDFVTAIKLIKFGWNFN